MKTAALPPYEVPLPGIGRAKGCVSGRTGKFEQSQNTPLFLKALFPIRVDNLQQGAAFHFTKYAAFFEKWRGVRGEEKNFGADVRLFLVKKSFSLLPGSHLPLSGTARFYKIAHLKKNANDAAEKSPELLFQRRVKIPNSLCPVLVS